MNNLPVSLTLQQWIEQRLIDVLGISPGEAHQVTDQARMELGKIRTNFNWSKPVRQTSLFARRFAWELVLDEVAQLFELCPAEFRVTFGGDL